MRFVAVMCLITVGAALLVVVRSKDDPSSPARRALPEIAIRLLRPSTQVTATRLSEGEVARLHAGHFFEPHVLTIYLPDGKVVAVEARGVSFLTDAIERDVIVDIYVRRPLVPATFQEAVVDLHRTLSSAGYEPNETMQQMTTWGEVPGEGDRPGVTPYEHNAGGIRLSDEVGLHVSVKPDPQRGWYYEMLFQVTGGHRPLRKALRARGL